MAEHRTPGDALGYLALHHKKPKQAPPADWHGIVERHSLGKFHRHIAELRDLVRHQLRAEALSWSSGLPLELAALELDLNRWQPVLVAEYCDRAVIEPLLDAAKPTPASESDWLMRRGQFIHRLTGELWRPGHSFAGWPGYSRRPTRRADSGR